MPLTEAKLKSLKPKGKPYKVSDYDSLFVLVTPKGSKLWKFKFRLGGKEKSLSLGKYPAVSLKRARFLRDEARKLHAEGVDPAANKQKKKAKKASVSEHTFAKFAEKFLAKQLKEGKSEATIQKKEWLLRLAMDDLGDMPINEIKAQTVLKTLKKREALGHYETVRRLRATISAVFRYAVASGVAETDPTFALKDALIRPTVKYHAAITDKERLKEFLRALDSYGGKAETRIALKLHILFASRPGEIRKARWEEFDIEERIWNVPAERMKMRVPHNVPLSDAALALLGELRELTGWGALLFPSLSSAEKPISENTLNQALRRLGFSAAEVTSHGFRTTFSTFANESGLWSADAIEAYLSHQDKNAIRRTYNRAAYWDERVKIADWWAEKVTGSFF
ncbi:integrase [Litorimonas cladophorae]|uniref:Integrase n=1 Tax=Litorimonas cladophorae TaxID=1220491 RepID=A0A918NJT6_9PROT|nr:integrase arm-type DNA-binding domain-containing protein [Litorimonas cladophorae]GGX73197.1 integrase [Litorimonas cladophorae]